MAYVTKTQKAELRELDLLDFSFRISKWYNQEAKYGEHYQDKVRTIRHIAIRIIMKKFAERYDNDIHMGSDYIEEIVNEIFTAIMKYETSK